MHHQHLWQMIEPVQSWLISKKKVQAQTENIMAIGNSEVENLRVERDLENHLVQPPTQCRNPHNI